MKITVEHVPAIAFCGGSRGGNGVFVFEKVQNRTKKS